MTYLSERLPFAVIAAALMAIQFSTVESVNLQKVGDDTRTETGNIIKKKTCKGHKVPDVEYREVRIYDTEKGSSRTGELGNDGFRIVSPWERSECTNYFFIHKYSTEAAFSFYGHGNGKVAVMNFANAFKPGGGFLEGAKAQEETLCRCSTLYASLTSTKADKYYYGYNWYLRNHGNKDISARVMVSPYVLFMRNDQNGYEWESDPRLISVISAAAFDGRNGRLTDEVQPQVDKSMKDLIRNTVVAAIDGGYRTLILGAFGCGAFKHKPEKVARYFIDVLAEEGLERYFKNIVFAIPAGDDKLKKFADAFQAAGNRNNVKIVRNDATH